MSDDGVQVAFGADIASLLQGMKSSQDAVRTAAEGMKGDIGALIESFEGLGFAALGIGALGLAFEALKEAADFIPECIEATAKMSDEARQLGITAGMSTDEFNAWSTTLQISGAKTEDLNTIVQGMQRGIKANSDVLIANGIAADKAGLSHMTLGEYLSAVIEKMNTFADATDRDQLLMAAFGRGGMAFAATLVEINEHMKEGFALSNEGAVITERAIVDQKALTVAKGYLAHEEALNQALISSATIDTDIAFQRFKADSVKAINDVMLAQRQAKEGMVDYQFSVDEATGEVVVDWEKMGAEARRVSDQFSADMKHMAELKAQSAAGVGGTQSAAGGGGTHFKSKEDLSAEKAAADARVEAAKAAEEAEARVQAVLQKQRDKDQQEAQQRQDQDDQHAMDAREKATNEIIKDMEKAEKEKAELAELGAQAQLNASRSALEGQKLTLEQEVAMGGINVAEEISQRKHLLDMEDAMETQALQHELQIQKLTLVERTKIENQILLLHAKNNLEMQKLDNQLAQNDKRIMDQMTQGWDTYIQKGLEDTRKLGRTFESAVHQMASTMEKALINMGLDWAKFELLKREEGQKSHLQQNFLAAKTAAGNAWSSAADIPVVGWILAPVAAAAAFAGVMAFAEGGWDNVPSDQVAMIHKQEMVLPAHIANPLRESLAGGGSLGGGDTHVHLSVPSMDRRSVEQFFQKHGGTVLKALGKSARNGRFS